MENKDLTLRYAFVHIALKGIVLKDTETFIKIAQGGPDNLKGFLSFMWNDIKEKNTNLTECEDVINEESFDVSVSDLFNDEKLLIVKLPEPKNPSEAFYIGVTLNEEDAKFFTLELGDKTNIETGQVEKNSAYYIGKWEKDGSHVNFGKLSEMRPGLFAGKIEGILKNN